MAVLSLFIKQGFLLCRVYCPKGMLRWGVDGVKFQWLGADIFYIVPCARWDDNSVTGTCPSLKSKGTGVLSHLNQSAAIFDAQELIQIIVHFQPDFLPYRDTHKRYLQVISRP